MAGMNFYLNEACSICFENRCDFNFPLCQDQFCSSCIERYLNEVINNSWGLPVCIVKCPVCYDILSKNVWSKYVSRDMLARYDRYNQPYRPFARFCTSCGHETNPIMSPSLNPDAMVKAHQSITSMLTNNLTVSDDVKESFESAYCELEQGRTSVSDLYNMMLGHLTENNEARSKQLDGSSSRESLVIRMSGGQPEKRRRTSHPSEEIHIANLMAVIISLERTPDQWRRLQHAFVKSFPKSQCSACSLPICLQCGEANWHDGFTCEDYNSSLLEQATLDDDTRATLQWKLQNSKRCPSCAVVINRDDGCNKVDCLHCGFEFCWICLSAWSKSCGFFRCVSEPALSTNEDVSTTKHHSEKNDQPEVGVPDVAGIQKRLSMIIEQQESSRVAAAEAASGSRTIRNESAVPKPTPPTEAVVQVANPARPAHMPLVKDWLLGTDHDVIF